MNGKEANTYDAIVIGTGMSGGMAAMELCRKGLKTLVLERGRDIRHGDYPTANLDDWELPYGGRIPEEVQAKDYPYLSRKGYVMEQGGIHHFLKDGAYPYTEKKRFDWIRAYQTGGRSLVWGRQCYQLSELDFTANAREGIGVDWPIRYRDLQPWYDYVTRFVGVSGRAEGLDHFPDGPFQPPMPLNCAEEHLRQSVHARFPRIRVSEGRVAHLTDYDPAVHLGSRGNCQYRDRCRRGCPYGGYYSSNAGPLPVAEATGNMTLVNGAAVREIIYDADKKRASGVRVKLLNTGEEVEYFSRGVVFLCASALNSAAILLASRSSAQPNGLGNDNDQVGRNVMDHHHSVGASGQLEGYTDKYYKGRKPNGIYIPRFVNLGDAASKRSYLRGFGYQGGGSRGSWQSLVREINVAPGGELKAAITQPGSWNLGITGFGECLPNPDNRVTLNYDKLDADGLPTLVMDVAFGENEAAMRLDMQAYAAEMLEAAGVKNIRTFNQDVYPGFSIHEMGTARMGRDPKTSVLNQHNQVWNCQNLYVTDGAAMTSASCVNPSLTYLALTARAVAHAVKTFG
ncbi:GMC family oxidoreductase [Neolewinella lacunae]|uniref:GMC family oxidoreductase n=1 Tax=Neolewinella lacunae TaxID=1517758 RepID=A0A923TAN4_9BACT|nr:GMC family oxidoreductase [Neolewinella lacunae]MBC6996373.1 GMC family oxidoreductase [Neolewinella lacunae]MDN3636996.1 GMC family oxidoreductase [Neolewinella lacunae]